MTIDNYTPSLVGKIISVRRKGCYLSQNDLSSLAGIDKKTLNYIERGKTAKPHNSTIELIMTVLDKKESEIKKMKEELGLE